MNQQIEPSWPAQRADLRFYQQEIRDVLRYAGRWVVIKDSQLLFVGATECAAEDYVFSRRVYQPFLLRWVPLPKPR